MDIVFKYDGSKLQIPYYKTAGVPFSVEPGGFVCRIGSAAGYGGTETEAIRAAIAATGNTPVEYGQSTAEPVKVSIAEPKETSEGYLWEGKGSDGTSYLVTMLREDDMRVNAYVYGGAEFSELGSYTNGDLAPVAALQAAYEDAGMRATVEFSGTVPVEPEPKPASEESDEVRKLRNLYKDPYKIHKRQREPGPCAVCGCPSVVKADHQKVNADNSHYSSVFHHPVGYLKEESFGFRTGHVYNINLVFLEANGRTPQYNRERGITAFAKLQSWDEVPAAMESINKKRK